jgi:hypothetical protein
MILARFRAEPARDLACAVRVPGTHLRCSSTLQGDVSAESFEPETRAATSVGHGSHHDRFLLEIIGNGIGKSPHDISAHIERCVDTRPLGMSQRRCHDARQRFMDCQSELLAKARRLLVIPAARSQQVGARPRQRTGISSKDLVERGRPVERWALSRPGSANPALDLTSPLLGNGMLVLLTIEILAIEARQQLASLEGSLAAGKRQCLGQDLLHCCR